MLSYLRMSTKWRTKNYDDESGSKPATGVIFDNVTALLTGTDGKAGGREYKKIADCCCYSGENDMISWCDNLSED
mgnify:FL=1